MQSVSSMTWTRVAVSIISLHNLELVVDVHMHENQILKESDVIHRVKLGGDCSGVIN